MPTTQLSHIYEGKFRDKNENLSSVIKQHKTKNINSLALCRFDIKINRRAF